MTLRRCSHCSGLLPKGARVCPHCDESVSGRAGGAATALLGAAASLTLMACYGAPPGPPPEQPEDEAREEMKAGPESEPAAEAGEADKPAVAPEEGTPEAAEPEG